MTSTYTVPWRTEGNNTIHNGTGSVGIGTTAPSRILHLSGGNPYLRIHNTDGSGNSLLLGHDSNGVGLWTNLNTNADSGWTRRITIKNDTGNVSLGQLTVGENPFPPTTYTRINNNAIQFGGNNNGRETNSAQISAGLHQANSLNLVGMSDANLSNRRIDMWAEGGCFVRGNIGVFCSKGVPILVNSSNVSNISNGSTSYVNLFNISFTTINTSTLGTQSTIVVKAFGDYFIAGFGGDSHEVRIDIDGALANGGTSIQRWEGGGGVGGGTRSTVLLPCIGYRNITTNSARSVSITVRHRRVGGDDTASFYGMGCLVYQIPI
jgi:hypothetical protein